MKKGKNIFWEIFFLFFSGGGVGGGGGSEKYRFFNGPLKVIFPFIPILQKWKFIITLAKYFHHLSNEQNFEKFLSLLSTLFDTPHELCIYFVCLFVWDERQLCQCYKTKNLFHSHIFEKIDYKAIRQKFLLQTHNNIRIIGNILNFFCLHYRIVSEKVIFEVPPCQNVFTPSSVFWLVVDRW